MTEEQDNNSEESRNEDSKADAIAATGIIFALVAMVVFWVSNQ